MSRTYDFFYRPDGGRYDTDNPIKFPSVTTIISAVLAKPQLVPWAYGETLNALVGLVSTAAEVATDSPDVLLEAVLDTFSDTELLDEWIRENKAHHEDVSNAAADRGKDAHALLAQLALLYDKANPRAAEQRAEKVIAKPPDPYQGAVAQWWLDRKPRPVFSEKVVISLRHMYAGRFDLLADLPFDSGLPDETLVTRTLTDLKTRREGLPAYTSDEAQLDGYAIAAVEMGIEVSETAVLLAYSDGTYREHKCRAEMDGSFLPLVEFYWQTRKTGVFK